MKLLKNIPRLIITALRGGSGKTTVTLGIISAWCRIGHQAVPFKKGPDFIDAKWLEYSAGHKCCNLDPYLLGQEATYNLFLKKAIPDQLAIIEGNRGIFDGVDNAGTYSTAQLSRLLGAPVILVVDCTKVTRTMAAMILGCQKFEPALDLKGVILNNFAGERHKNILISSIEKYCGLPVVGAVPRIQNADFPERHMGLLPPQEHEGFNRAIKQMESVALEYIDLDKLYNIALNAPPLDSLISSDHKISVKSCAPVIGIAMDSSFWFYYHENIEALEAEGAKIVKISPLKDTDLNHLDGLYIGGGFPETHAAILSQNTMFKKNLRRAIEQGMPVYAECGGFMYLCRELLLSGKSYPMTGVIPATLTIGKKPSGHGYTNLKVVNENPYYPIGMEIKGHEFHYSKVTDWGGEDNFSCKVKRGIGIYNDMDGFSYKNLWASYTHIHAIGVPHWAAAFVELVKKFKTNKKIS